MARALWNGIVIADSAEVRVVDGYTYFPPDAVRRDLLHPTTTTTRCSWKGTASYFDVSAEGQVNSDAAWSYPKTSEAARHIDGWIGFWRGVTIEG